MKRQLLIEKDGWCLNYERRIEALKKTVILESDQIALLHTVRPDDVVFKHECEEFLREIRSLKKILNFKNKKIIKPSTFNFL